MEIRQGAAKKCWHGSVKSGAAAGCAKEPATPHFVSLYTSFIMERFVEFNPPKVGRPLS